MPPVTPPPDEHDARSRPNPLRALGPGLLFAGAAIGVSHLVQSTTAGALYGLSLVIVVVLAHAMKLPAMLFGPRYSAATGTSLLSAYRRQGRHALWTFALINFGTMFTNEPLPEAGYITLPETAGFGLELNRDALNLVRPYTH